MNPLNWFGWLVNYVRSFFVASLMSCPDCGKVIRVPPSFFERDEEGQLIGRVWMLPACYRHRCSCGNGGVATSYVRVQMAGSENRLRFWCWDSMLALVLLGLAFRFGILRWLGAMLRRLAGLGNQPLWVVVSYAVGVVVLFWLAKRVLHVVGIGIPGRLSQ